MLNMYAIRISIGVTQKDMAQLLDVPLPTYKSWEQGRCLPNFEHSEKIHQTLCDLDKSDEAVQFLNDYIEAKKERFKRK